MQRKKEQGKGQEETEEDVSVQARREVQGGRDKKLRDRKIYKSINL